MDRINHSSAPNRRWVAKDPNIPNSGTVITKDWLQSIDDELINLIEKSGIEPESNDLEQIYKAILKIIEGKITKSDADKRSTYSKSVLSSIVESFGGVVDENNINQLSALIQSALSKLALKSVIYSKRSIYVSTTGDDLRGDGTSVKPFKTIRVAVESVPMGGVADIVLMGDGIETNIVNIHNKIIYINISTRKELRWNGNWTIDGGIVRVYNCNIVFDSLPTYNGRYFAISGTGVVNIGGYDGAVISRVCDNSKPLIIGLVDYDLNPSMHVRLSRLSKTVNQEIYARSAIYGGIATSELWQCTGINDSI